MLKYIDFVKVAETAEREGFKTCSAFEKEIF